MTFKTNIIGHYEKNHARVTKITTAHGELLTPAFMPVATRAAVNHMTPQDLTNAGSQIILGGNTYHMLLAPGLDTIQQLGGMHRFMDWQGPMLTDSGGFQVFSLSQNSKICRIKEDGAHFKHPISGQLIHLTPERSIETQKIIGADIIMAFDQCTPDTADKFEVISAMKRTKRWLLQSKECHDKNIHSAYGYDQALFGIIQGGQFQELREQCTHDVVAMDFDGIAIGGESIGFDMPKTQQIIDWVRPYLPPEKTRYTMGVGLDPQDLIDVVASGIDIFDCVAPTRNARHGTLYCGQMKQEGDWFRFVSDLPRARLSIKKAIYKNDDQPIIDDCSCYTCQHYSRGYLHYLNKQRLLLYSQLACIHNIHVMHHVCEVMRNKILSDLKK